MKKSRFIAGIVFFGALPLLGQPSRISNQAQDILTAAVKTTLNATFKAEKTDKVHNLARKRVLYHRNEQGFNLLRRETFLDDKLATVEISNQSGDYTIFMTPEVFSIRKDMSKSLYNLELSEHFITAINTLQDYVHGCTYDLTQETFNGEPVHVIKVVSPSDVKELAKMMGATEEKTLKNKNRYWKYRIARIGVKDNFIYTIDIYIFSGRKSHSYDWGVLDFTADVPDTLFASPTNPMPISSKEEMVEKVEKRLRDLRKNNPATGNR